MSIKRELIKKVQYLAVIGSVLILSSFSSGKSITVKSPDRNIAVKFQVTNGVASYEVAYRNQKILDPSALGFDIKNQPPLGGDFKLVKSNTSVFNETWDPVWGDVKTVQNNYTQLTVYLEETSATKRRLNIVFRVFNDGVGFRYEIPEQENLKSFEIMAENTEFNFSSNDTAWWVKGNPDTDEMLYSKTPLSEIDSANTPVTIKVNDKLYLSIHEAALYNYSSMRLFRKTGSSTSFYSGLVPWPDGVMVKTQAPMKTPWRTILIVTSAGKLIESHLVQNLNEPNKIKDISWIKPMKYVGIWWGMHLGIYSWPAGPKHGSTTENAKRYIDFASKHDMGGVLYEGWNKGWETWGSTTPFDFSEPYPDFDINEVVRYGNSKGVEMIAHHETGSNVEYYEKHMDSAFVKFEKLGIHNLKTGYVGNITTIGQHHHGQWMVEHYQRVVEKAAQHKINLDVHECIKPTGICRTWPNLLSGEGVRGSEWNAWGGGNPASHTATIPFTRMLAGPLDYTPGIFDILYTYRSKNVPPDTSYKQRTYSTLANQLALMLVLYSPVQMASDLIENYENQPAFKFIEDISTSWDDTKVLNASIGEYVTIARKKGNNWFVGSITNEKARSLQLSLSFLDPGKKYRAEIYADSDQTDMLTNPTAIAISTIMVDSKSTINLKLAGSGGQAISIFKLE